MKTHLSWWEAGAVQASAQHRLLGIKRLTAVLIVGEVLRMCCWFESIPET